MEESEERKMGICHNCIIASLHQEVRKYHDFLSTKLHGIAQKEVFHFDNLYIDRGTQGTEFLLLLKEEFSSYCWLVPYQRNCAAESAGAVLNWIRTFTAMCTWISDQ